MVRESDLPEINGLVARLNSLRHKGAPLAAQWDVFKRLMALDVHLDNPVPPPDPTAPPGGTAVRVAA